jgi:hypothetical protein
MISSPDNLYLHGVRSVYVGQASENSNPEGAKQWHHANIIYAADDAPAGLPYFLMLI